MPTEQLHLLVTGFEPFGGSVVNPSEQAAAALAQTPPPGLIITPAILPVDRLQGPAALLTALKSTQPQVVICLGEASRRPAISLERVALNLLDYRIPDNSGQTVIDEPVVPDGPAAYFSTLPLRAMLAAMQAAGVPAELSLSAGAYLCNQVMYTLLHHLAETRRSIPAGFIHLPALPIQAAATSTPYATQSLEMTLLGLRAALGTLTPSAAAAE